MPDEHDYHDDPPTMLKFHLANVQLKLDFAVHETGKHGYCRVDIRSKEADLRPDTPLVLVLALRMINAALREEFGVDGIATLQQELGQH